MVTDSGRWTNRFIENFAVVDHKMPFSGHKNVISFCFQIRQ